MAFFGVLGIFWLSTVDGNVHREQGRRGPVRGVLVWTAIGALQQHQAYVWDSIRQARLFNPRTPMHLIVSNATNATRAAAAALGVTLHTYTDDAAFARVFFVANDMRPPGGQRDFVRRTTERLWALRRVATEHRLEHIVHLGKLR